MLTESFQVRAVQMAYVPPHERTQEIDIDAMLDYSDSQDETDEGMVELEEEDKNAETEESARATWNERRRRLAIKRFGGVKDEYLSSQHHQYNAGGPEGSTVPSNAAGGNNTNMSGGAPSSGMGGGGYGTHHFTPQVRNKLGLHPGL